MNDNVTYSPIDNLETDVGNLRVQLGKWSGGRFNPERKYQRIAVEDALDSIDAAVELLHTMRAELVTQKLRYDDDAMRRTDRLLREIRAERHARSVEQLDRDQADGRARRSGGGQ